MEKSYASPSSGELPGMVRTYSGRPVKVIPLQHPSPATASAFSLSETSSSVMANWRSTLKAMSITEWICVFLPCYRWIRSYDWKEYLQPDLMSGITVGVMLVPQVVIFLSLLEFVKFELDRLLLR
uniref:SLC26A/SulP transporter domain-containing protein n=1 Tax=Opuntia streptacantha TaxID=393608 RepID=A0A7C9DES1_OPUST